MKPGLPSMEVERFQPPSVNGFRPTASGFSLTRGGVRCSPKEGSLKIKKRCGSRSGGCQSRGKKKKEGEGKESGKKNRMRRLPHKTAVVLMLHTTIKGDSSYKPHGDSIQKGRGGQLNM